MMKCFCRFTSYCPTVIRMNIALLLRLVGCPQSFPPDVAERKYPFEQTTNTDNRNSQLRILH